MNKCKPHLKLKQNLSLIIKSEVYKTRYHKKTHIKIEVHHTKPQAHATLYTKERPKNSTNTQSANKQTL